MKQLLHARSTYIIGAVLLIGIALLSLVRVLKTPDVELVTATVSKGDVEEIVPVSGVIESRSTANLAFPVNDIVASVTVREGDTVAEGQILATLQQAGLLADRQNAFALLEIATANRDELIAGPRIEERALTESAIEHAEADIIRTTSEENAKVANARLTLNSASLEALPISTTNDDSPPTITGTYNCEETGEYVFEVYPSNSSSGYSYQLTGLGTDTHTAYTDAPFAFGSCGLSIQFIAGELYSRDSWSVVIPNTRASSYAANINAYTLAIQKRDDAIAEAEEALTLAKQNQTLADASPRDEALRRANAEIQKAQAQLASVNAKIAERTLRAPFEGIITSVDIVVGETVSSGNVVTITGDNTFELTVRIPEIDIAKISVGQFANTVFDARTTEMVPATISFISPLATEIDGVAYFEAKIVFDESPTWLRAGLNADIDITVYKVNDVLRIPKRFLLTSEEGTHSVLLLTNNATITETTVEIGFSGNDGFVEIISLNEGDTIVAP